MKKTFKERCYSFLSSQHSIYALKIPNLYNFQSFFFLKFKVCSLINSLLVKIIKTKRKTLKVLSIIYFYKNFFAQID